jgi:hypothetical protein
MRKNEFEIQDSAKWKNMVDARLRPLGPQIDSLMRKILV